MSARDELARTLDEWLDDEAPLNLRRYIPVADAILAAGYAKIPTSDYLRAAGWVRPRTITTAEELDALPKLTVIRAVKTRNPRVADYFERFLSGWIHLDPSDREDGEGTVKSAEVLKWFGDLSVTVLYEPTP